MKILSISLMILLISGCSTVVNSAIGVHIDVDAEANLDVDVLVGEKIIGEARGTFLFDSYWSPKGYICIQCPQEFTANVLRGPYYQLKSAAIYEAMEGTGADLIINPQYTIERDWNPFWSKVHVTVTGRIGTINNIEKDSTSITYQIDLD